MTLRQNTISAVRWTAISAATRAFLQVAQLAVLGRILLPQDFGLMAIVAVVLGVAMLFADLGLNSAYVQRQEVRPEERSSLFWMNLGMSGLLCLLLVVCSPLLAGFFGDSRLSPLFSLAALVFVINALGQQIRMTQEKKLNFKPVAYIEISALILGFTCAVGAALAGGGVYALVIGVLVTSSASSVMAWFFISEGWRPSKKFSWDHVRSYLGFGGAMVGNGIANQINLNMDVILGGRMLAATQLGFYSVPRNLVLQAQFSINRIITRVGFPLISQVQHDIEKVRKIYLKTMNITASVNAPFFIFSAFYANEIILVLVGSNWIESVEIFQILALWAFFRSLGNPVGSLLFGTGRAGLSFKWNLSMLFIVPPILWVGSGYGPLGLATALLAFSIFGLIPAWRILVYRVCGLKLIPYLLSFLVPLAIAVCAGAISKILILILNLENELAILPLGLICFGVVYWVGSYIFKCEWIMYANEFIKIKKPLS